MSEEKNVLAEKLDHKLLIILHPSTDARTQIAFGF